MALHATRPRFVVALLLLLGLPWVMSCSTLGYYGQAARGQMAILLKRHGIAKLVASPDTPEALRRQLATVQDLRNFAVGALGLPDNGSYRTYVQLKPNPDGTPRRAVVWNVVAAPALDVTPLVWCFPVAGCVAYRGYFSEARARRFARGLAAEGYDVDVAGAAAYSTLGWFKDPVVSTVVDYPEPDLAGLLFHELAHQLIYVKDDSSFNESFATAVEIEGVRRWLAVSGRESAVMEGYLERKRHQEAFNGLVLSTRDRLQAMYGEDLPEARKRERKRLLFAELETAYRELSAGWDKAARPGYDRWFERELNNARLVSVATYHDLVPAFQALLGRHDGNLPSFYGAVRDLAAQSPEERRWYDLEPSPHDPTEGDTHESTHPVEPLR